MTVSIKRVYKITFIKEFEKERMGLYDLASLGIFYVLIR